MASGKKRPSISTVGERCCGCGACAAACPVSCLKMVPDSCGFMHPAYEHGCIGCGMCAKACPVLTVGAKDEVASVSWAKAEDDGLRGRSSSGAVFGLLAESVLDAGGAVYGAAFTDGYMAVRHVRVVDQDSLDAVMRSKYVQSAVGAEVYGDIESDLLDGRKVLFSGTACQIAAMRNYLALEKAPAGGLLLVEVVCHGVPSPRLWAEWLDYNSYEARAEVDSVNFRDKSTGWSGYSVRYGARDGSDRLASHDGDWYMRAFLQNASLRQSCLACPAKRRCGSDLTLGDFWGIGRLHPEAAADDMGISAVICNTERGVMALGSIRGALDCGPSSLEEVVAGNPSVMESVRPYAEREEFLADVASGMAIGDLARKWAFEPTIGQRVRGKLSGLKRRLLGGGRR